MIPTGLQEAGALLMSWGRVLILSHDRPDGDALGAMGAMSAILQALGKTARAGVYEMIPARYQFLEESCTFSSLPAGSAHTLELDFDGILILDTCSWAQLDPVSDFLKVTRLPKLTVDHHATCEDLAGAGTAHYLVDAKASATCTLLCEWAEAMAWPISQAAATALFTGIVTDTGWFRFPSTDPQTMRAAAGLLERGLRPDIMYARLMDAYSTPRVRLVASTLATMQLHAGGRLSVMQLRPEMLAQAGATPGDTEDLVNEPLRSREILASVLLVDLGDGKIRVNFRSKSPEIVGFELDVATVAGRFGGGGHRRAAGARVNGTLDEVLPRVIAAMSELFKPASAA
jgi:phosphoesterase RecJ-like protein